MWLFFFKQKTAYEMRISDGSSDVCSSDLFQEGGLPRRTIEPGTARKPAFLKSASLQPSNFDGTLSHQWVVRPGPPAMSPMSLSLKESSTAFLSHWLTVHPPAPFSATRKLPLSRPDSAASTASRTSPRVAALT